MKQRLRYSLKYIHYLLFAKHKKGHGIHSPFLFKLTTEVFNDKIKDKRLKQVFLAYNKIKRSKQILTFEEIGAGSSYKNLNQITVGEIVQKSSINKKYGQLLYNLIKFFDPETILEIGTSVGISTAFIAMAAPNANFKTIEGVIPKIEIAKRFSAELKLNPEFIAGNFDYMLDSVLEKYPTLDLVFFDGNHTKEATLHYFNQCLSKINTHSVFVFDDIHWSEDMESAWDAIKQNKNVILSVDLFRLGLIFFRKELSKEHYVIKF